MREERIARLLDDPEKLRELRQQRAERKAGKQQHEGRHWSMGEYPESCARAIVMEKKGASYGNREGTIGRVVGGA